MGGFGKILPFIDLNSSESITSSYITCIANNYQFQMMLIFVYYMEIKYNNSNYRQISTFLLAKRRLCHGSILQLDTNIR